MKRTLAIIAATIALTACGSTTANPGRIQGPGTMVYIPNCEEDEPYLQGKGDFDGTHWDYYVCVHIDQVTVTR